MSAFERLEWFADEIGVNSPERAEEKLDAFQKQMPADPSTEREVEVLLSWLGSEGRPKTFTSIAKDFNIRPEEARIFRDNAVKTIQQFIRVG